MDGEASEAVEIQVGDPVSPSHGWRRSSFMNGVRNTPDTRLIRSGANDAPNPGAPER